jgi:hypothetical protein
MFTNGDRVINEWTLTATKAESFLGSRMQIPISVQGVSIVQVQNGKISQWLDYYDSTKSRRNSIAFWFTEWIEA